MSGRRPQTYPSQSSNIFGLRPSGSLSSSASFSAASPQTHSPTTPSHRSFNIFGLRPSGSFSSSTSVSAASPQTRLPVTPTHAPPPHSLAASKVATPSPLRRVHTTSGGTSTPVVPANPAPAPVPVTNAVDVLSDSQPPAETGVINPGEEGRGRGRGRGERRGRGAGRGGRGGAVAGGRRSGDGDGQEVEGGQESGMEIIPAWRLREIRAFEKERDAAASRAEQNRDHGISSPPSPPPGHAGLPHGPAALGRRVRAPEPEPISLGPRVRRPPTGYEPPPAKRTMSEIRAAAATRKAAEAASKEKATAAPAAALKDKTGSSSKRKASKRKQENDPPTQAKYVTSSISSVSELIVSSTLQAAEDQVAGEDNERAHLLAAFVVDLTG
ncbi:hypothetical protein B0H14DRAFT_3520219 [Mycena olivaceomarginata]|nr:hypothetical protein B0H14DRAFT_3520219 [Mycena olivaceomarginata]